MAEHNVYINIVVRTAQMRAGLAKTEVAMAGLGKTTGRIIRTMTAFAALFIARGMIGGMVSAIKAAGDLSLQMAHISRITHITGTELNSLRAEFLNLSTTMVASVDELAELAIVAARAGVHTRKGMVDIAIAASMMGNVTDMSAVQATNALVKIIKSMNLTMDEAQNLGSMIVWTGKQFAATENEIVSAMLRMLPAAKTMGVTASQLAVLGAMTVEVGNQARRAGTVWNRAMFQMSKNISKAADLMGISVGKLSMMIEKDAIGAILALMTAISQLPSKVARLKAVQSIFALVGARGVAPLIDKIEILAEKMKGSANAFLEGTELMSDFNIILQEFNSRTKLAGDAWKRLQIAIATDALPALGRFANVAAKELNQMAIEIEAGDNKFMTFFKRTPFYWKLMNILREEFGLMAETNPFPNATIESAEKMTAALDNLAIARERLAAKDAAGIVSVGDETGTGGIVDEQLAEQLETFRLFQEEKAGVLLEGNDMLKSIVNEFGDWNKEQTISEQAAFLNAQREQLQTTIDRIGKEAAAEKGLIKLKEQLNLASVNLTKKLWLDNAQAVLGVLGTLQSALQGAAAQNKAFAVAAKVVAIAMAVINTAVGMTKALADWGWPWGLIAAGIIGAAGAIQIGTIAAQGFKKGGIVGGQGRGDKVPALLEPGEAVIPRQDVKNFTDNSRANVTVSMAGALIMDDPNAVEKLYREYLQDRIKQDIRTGRDVFYG